MAKAGLIARLFNWLTPANDDARPPDQEDPASQYAALVWRRRKGQVEVLLVTSRETRRWIIPKGWPMKNRSPHEAAAREAFEEAGVEGKPVETPLGAFHYDKLLKSGDVRHCAVEVFSMKVVKTLEKWPEKGQRERKWFPAQEAAGLVAEPELAAIIQAFGTANVKAKA
jgi:8-oxo-dGTP pyrophosphatase MutT (NUDIX family)